VARAAFLVTDPIEREQDLAAILSGFPEDRLDNIGRSIGKSWKVAIAIDVEDVIEQKQHVIDGRFIDRHEFPHRRVLRKSAARDHGLRHAPVRFGKKAII
jgi:hypothetical protein